MAFSGHDAPYALVATVRYLLLVNLHTGAVTPIENSRTEYYGITWRPNSEALILGHSGTDNAALHDIAGYANSETGWVSEGVAHRSPTFLSAPHQILCGSDGRVICTNTGRNCITVVDLAKPGHYQEHRVSAARWDRLSLQGDTADHLNSVYERNGRLYVLAHAHGQGSFVSVLQYPDLSPVENWPRMRITGLHNIWVDASGQAVSCHSSAAAIVDVRSGARLWQAGSPVYLRGLAACDEYIIVGESEVTGRDLRRSSHSGLWILDRKSWSALDYLSLGPYGAVNEVRLLNVPDIAHHGQIFCGWQGLLTQGVSQEIANSRLIAERGQQRTRALWQGFDDIFGAYTTDENGIRFAADDCLCLSTYGETLQKKTAFRFGVDYALRANDGISHVSIVLGYRGRGSDSHMAAILIQSAGSEARLSYWINDGGEWRSEPVVATIGLPLAATLNVVSDGNVVTISVAGHVIHALPSDQVVREPGRLGVRWIGAGVKPIPA